MREWGNQVWHSRQRSSTKAVQEIVSESPGKAGTKCRSQTKTQLTLTSTTSYTEEHVTRCVAHDSELQETHNTM